MLIHRLFLKPWKADPSIRFFSGFEAAVLGREWSVMDKRKITVFILVFSMIIITGCASPTAPQETATGGAASLDEEVLPTSTTGEPTNTPTPTDVPAPTPSPLPSATSPPPTPMLSSLGADLLCRFGPGEEYALSGTFLMDDTSPVIGRDEEQAWFVVEHPRMPGRYCWLAADDTRVDGDINAIPVSLPPENIVLGVSASLEPAVIKLSSCSFPVTFDAFFTIEISGPVSVTYRKVSNEGTSGWKTKSFSTGGAKSFSEEFKVDSPGTYFYRVEVSSPNVIQGETSGQVTCP